MIVLDEGPRPLAEGTKVRVEPVDVEKAVQDLSGRLLSVAGIATGLPKDMASQHAHYNHGTPKP